MCDLYITRCNQRARREDEMLAQQPETFQPSQMFLDCRVFAGACFIHLGSVESGRNGSPDARVHQIDACLRDSFLSGLSLRELQTLVSHFFDY